MDFERSVMNIDGKQNDKQEPDRDPEVEKLPRLLSIPELAKWLGVSVRYIRRLVHERRIPHIKMGHFVRFDQDDIRTWIDRSRRPDHGGGAEGWAS